MATKTINWIPEAEAAQKLGRHPRVLRNNVKQGKTGWEISYTTINGRNYYYSEDDINRLFNRNAVIAL